MNSNLARELAAVALETNHLMHGTPKPSKAILDQLCPSSAESAALTRQECNLLPEEAESLREEADFRNDIEPIIHELFFEWQSWRENTHGVSFLDWKAAQNQTHFLPRS